MGQETIHHISGVTWIHRCNVAKYDLLISQKRESNFSLANHPMSTPLSGSKIISMVSSAFCFMIHSSSLINIDLPPVTKPRAHPMFSLQYLGYSLSPFYCRFTTNGTDVAEYADEGKRTDGNKADHVRVRLYLPSLHGRHT